MPEQPQTEVADRPTEGAQGGESVSVRDAEGLEAFSFERAFGDPDATAVNPPARPEEAVEAPPDGESVSAEGVTAVKPSEGDAGDGQAEAEAEREAVGDEPAEAAKARRAKGHDDRRREIDEAVARALAAQEEAAVATAEADRLRREQQALHQEALARIGTDADYDALRRRVAELKDEAAQAGIQGYALDLEKARRLQELDEQLRQKDEFRAYWGIFAREADHRYRQVYGSETLAAGDELGLPRERVAEVLSSAEAIRDIPKGFYEAGRASRDAEVEELKAQVSRLEADNGDLLTKTASTARSPERGGRPGPSTPTRADVIDLSRPLSDDLEELFSFGPNGR